MSILEFADKHIGVTVFVVIAVLSVIDACVVNICKLIFALKEKEANNG